MRPSYLRQGEYTRRLAKRLGMDVEQYLATKADLAGKKLASHPAAVERREIRKAATQARRAAALPSILAAREQQARDRAQRQADMLARYPWRDQSLSNADRYQMRYRLDPEFRIKESLRAQLKKKRRGRAGNWGYCLRRALMVNGTAPSMEVFLGFTIAQLHQHIERQFTQGMDWLRFMAGDIHIDHIIPLASFDMTNDDDVRAAWAITNLRPMWARDSMVKGAKVLTLL